MSGIDMFFSAGGWDLYVMIVLAAVCLLGGAVLVLGLGSRVRAENRTRRQIMRAESLNDLVAIDLPHLPGHKRLAWLLGDIESLPRDQGDQLLADGLRGYVHGPARGWWIAAYVYVALACVGPVLWGAMVRLKWTSVILAGLAAMPRTAQNMEPVRAHLQAAGAPLWLGIAIAMLGVLISAGLWMQLTSISKDVRREMWLQIAQKIDLVDDASDVRRLTIPSRRGRAAVVVTTALLFAMSGGVLTAWQAPVSVSDNVFWFSESPAYVSNRLKLPEGIDLVQGKYRNIPPPSSLLVIDGENVYLEGRSVDEPLDRELDREPDRFVQLVVPEEGEIENEEKRLRKRWALEEYMHRPSYERLQALVRRMERIARYGMEHRGTLSVIVAADANLKFERIAPVLAAIHTAGIEQIYLASAVEGTRHVAAALPVDLRVGPRKAGEENKAVVIRACEDPAVVLASSEATWRDVLGLCHELAPHDGRPLGLVAAVRGALPEVPAVESCEEDVVEKDADAH